MAILIGCGSWADSEYVEVLYPKGLPPKSRLHAYAQWFDRVEVNSTYYALPRREVVADWVKQTPASFLFDLKLQRAFSEDPAKATANGLVERLLSAIQPLIGAKKIGAFLLVLAPSFRPKRHRLEELDLLAEKLQPHPLAVELRDRAWIEGDALDTTLAHFRAKKLVWVALDMPRIKASSLLPAIDEVTTPHLAYLRLHGRNLHYLDAKSAEDRHAHNYTRQELQEIVPRIQHLAAHATDVHVSVNNHAKDFAPIAAIALRQLLGQPVRNRLPEIGNAPEGGDEQLPLL